MPFRGEGRPAGDTRKSFHEEIARPVAVHTRDNAPGLVLGLFPFALGSVCIIDDYFPLCLLRITVNSTPVR